MKRIGCIIAVLLVVTGLFASTALGQAKLAQTGLNFLSVGTDARATGMGEAFTTIEGSSSSLFYNPAGIAGIKSFVDLSMSQMKWIVDIKYLSGAVAFRPFEGRVRGHRRQLHDHRLWGVQFHQGRSERSRVPRYRRLADAKRLCHRTRVRESTLRSFLRRRAGQVCVPGPRPEHCARVQDRRQ